MTASTTPVASWVEAFERLEKELGRDGLEWLGSRRRHAIERFAELGFPSTRLEDWKYTSVAPIERTRFTPELESDSSVDAARIAPHRIAGDEAIELVFVDGRPVPAMSSVERLPAGLRVESLRAALRDSGLRARLEERYAAVADAERRPFVALNTAMTSDGALVLAERGTVVEAPIHLLFVNTAGGGAAIAGHPRVLVSAGETAELRVIESHVGLGSGTYLSNGVTECWLEPHAIVDHTKIQDEGPAAFHISAIVARQERQSRFVSRSYQLGAALARQDVDVLQAAEGIECELYGLYVAGGSQHVDHHTAVDHAHPHGSSRELYKGILDGAAHGVFNGRVVVRPGAQKTDSRQTNRNLLLSRDAVIDTKPELEIFADDVKCAHGATIGQLDEIALFYMRSRGIAADDARHMLIRAFAGELIDRLPAGPVREGLEQRLARRLDRGPSGGRP